MRGARRYLYGQTFERAAKLFGASWAQAFLGFIAISRAGWRESDFRVLPPRATGKEWDELRFASLRRLFRGQVRQRGAIGQWDVNHAQMRVAIRQHLHRRRIAETRRALLFLLWRSSAFPVSEAAFVNFFAGKQPVHSISGNFEH